MAVRGYSIETPGADYETREALGYRVIEGTSDTPVFPYDSAFNQNARRYAEAYNR